MYQQIQIRTNEELTLFCAPPGLPPLNPETISRHNADAHWMLTNSSTGEIEARCSLWWQSTPPYPNRRLGLIGHYGASKAEAAKQLLQLACDQLAIHNCTLAVGPMDGNTWQQYRLITEHGSELPFFLEPNNPDSWPSHFTKSGFTELAQYISTINPDLSQFGLEQDHRLAKVAARVAGRDIKIRALRLDSFDEELHHIYNIVLASFSNNFLYTPLSEVDFKAIYYPLRPYIQPELILIAEREGLPIGFIFALPDLLQGQRDHTINTVIIKTVAVHPEYQIMGLGSLLVARCQEVAHDLGYKRAIHALMHETNDSRKISRRDGTQIIRRYALFAKELIDEYR